MLLAACAKSAPGAGERLAADTAKSHQARPMTAAAFRLPDHGGTLSIYMLPGLDTTSWGGASRLGGARAAVGADLPGRRLLFVDSTGSISSFDLVSLRQKTIAPRHSITTIAADGSLMAVDSAGDVIESHPYETPLWHTGVGRGVTHVFAAPGPELLVIRHTQAGDSLEIASKETGVSQSARVPDAVDVVASVDGDAVAFATDSGIVVDESSELTHPWFVKLEGHPRALTFTPSGHRLYVALKDKNELAVIDRFSRKQRGSVSLPGPATALRADPWGRAIMARGEGTQDIDIWVIGIARDALAGTLHGTWSSDLPAATEGGVILSREGTSVVARDIHTLDSVAAVEGGARDLWFAGRWVPTSATAGVRAAAALGDTTHVQNQRSTVNGQRPTADTTQRGSPSTASREPPTPKPAAQQAPTFWIQLTSTTSEAQARSLVAELHSAAAQVLTPKTEDDTWRVVVGPFWTRDAADSAGRSIGKPYWVLDRARDARVRP
jgi:cell division septation protein DedD